MDSRRRLRPRAMAAGFVLLYVIGAAPRQPLDAAPPPPQPPPPPVTIEIGQPAVWSLAQAHYLLANMHQENRGLKVPMPTTELNPNTANGARLDFLRSALSADVQYSAPQGTQNRLNQERFDVDFSRREALRAAIDERRAQLDEINRGLIELKLQLADVQGELAGMPPEAAAQDVGRKGRVAQLTAQIDARTTQKDLLAATITSLAADEKALTVTQPTLGAPSPSGAPIADSLTPLMGKVLDKVGNPSLSASMALDNFVQMQYEVIAKQLTLLRDEVGPEERVLFLELPSSIYTVPSKADDYLVQQTWTVAEVLEGDLAGCNPNAQPTLDKAARPSKEEQDADELVALRSRPELSAAILRQPDKLQNAILAFCGPHVANRIGRARWQPIRRPGENVDRVRTVDIIPRQSALNVNDHHATQKSINLTGLFQLLSGVGAKVSYERQRTMYEQFLHQEVFASGFGKGRAAFGWTFGPVPGTKRLAPGIRNTYAVLVVPRNTIGIKLEAEALPFKRKQAPSESKSAPTKESFDILVPRELTDGFWIDRITYTPVARGQRVVAVLGGAQISPQVGILVNGVPLRRAVAIGRHESALTSSATGALGIDGEYEYVNADTIIASFSMGESFVGTPTIVLVTPEKTSAINSLDLIINYSAVTKLTARSLTEPMFTEPFDLKKAEPLASSGQIRLTGTGFRPRATITIDGTPVSSTVHSHTQEYLVTPATFPAGRFTAQILQPTRQGFELRDVTFQPQAPRSAGATVLDFRQEAAHRFHATLELSVPGSGALVMASSTDYDVLSQQPLGGDKFLAVLRVKRDDFLLNVSRGASHVIAVNIPVSPTVRRVENMTTGRPSGPAGAETLVGLQGLHLQHVVRVFFGDREGTLVNVADNGNVVFVRTPKGDPATTPVYVETSLEYRGRTLTNAADFSTSVSKPSFTFVKTTNPAP